MESGIYPELGLFFVILARKVALDKVVGIWIMPQDELDENSSWNASG